MWEALLSFRDHRSRSLLGKCNTAQQIPLGEGLCFSTFLGFSPQCHLTCCCKTPQLHVTAGWMNIEKKMTNTQQPDHIWTVGRSYDSVTSWRPGKSADFTLHRIKNTPTRLSMIYLVIEPFHYIPIKQSRATDSGDVCLYLPPPLSDLQSHSEPRWTTFAAIQILGVGWLVLSRSFLYQQKHTYKVRTPRDRKWC